MRQARTCARLTTSRAIIYLRARDIRVVVVARKCLTPIREWCNLSLVETKQPTEIAHMKIELDAEKLYLIAQGLNLYGMKLLEQNAVQDDKLWSEYKNTSALERAIWKKYKKAFDKELNIRK
jgi:hypothetical protein